MHGMKEDERRWLLDQRQRCRNSSPWVHVGLLLRYDLKQPWLVMQNEQEDIYTLQLSCPFMCFLDESNG